MTEFASLGEQLSLAVYRLTELFPEHEPLRAKIRILALDIVLAMKQLDHGTIADDPIQSLKERIDGMLLLFRIAKVQGFAEEKNFILLSEYYEQLKKSAVEDCAPALAPQDRKTTPASSSLRSSSAVRSPAPFGLGLPDKTPPVLSELRADASVVGRNAASALENVSALHAASPELLNKRQKKVVQHFRLRQSFQLREVRSLFEGYSQKTLRNDLKELCGMGILNREGVGTVSYYRVVDGTL